MERQIDTEIVEQLKNSRRALGEFYPILIDYDGEILAGNHRSKAGWKKVQRIDSREVARKLNVSVDLAKLLIKMHTNVQRRVRMEETQLLLLKCAEELEKMGVPKERICAKLAELTPYSQFYISHLLPSAYKMPTKSEIKPLSKSKHLKPLAEEAKPLAEVKSLPEPKPHYVPDALPEQAEQDVEEMIRDVDMSFLSEIERVIEPVRSIDLDRPRSAQECPCGCGWKVEVDFVERKIFWHPPVP